VAKGISGRITVADTLVARYGLARFAVGERAASESSNGSKRWAGQCPGHIAM